MLAVILAMLLGVAAGHDVRGTGTLPFAEQRVTRAVDHRMTATAAIGASVAVVHNGRIVYEKGFGTRTSAGPAVDANTYFEIGSLTKQFTAAAILQLREQNKLSIDDPLVKYVPAFPHAREITLQELLNQTSGLPDFVMTNGFVGISQRTTGSFARIERMASGPLHFVPGSRWEYSNTNYIALGRVIEVVSRINYDRFVREHLFARASMTHTTTIAHEGTLADRASGYWRGMRGAGSLVPAPSLPETWAGAAGDIVSTAGDIARWDIALESGKVISRGDFALMTAPARLTNGKMDDYGFHWWTDPLHGHRLLSGLGDTFGFSSCNDLFPDDHMAIVVLENSAVNPDGTSDAAAGVAESIFNALDAPNV